ncbi:hypothetical protein RFI_33784, partial [Reticulomyxa filosa]
NFNSKNFCLKFRVPIINKTKKMKQAKEESAKDEAKTEEYCLQLFLKNNKYCPIQSRDIKCDFKGKLKDLNNHLIYQF